MFGKTGGKKFKVGLKKERDLFKENQVSYFWILKWGNDSEKHFFMRSGKIIEKDSTQLVLKRDK